MRKSILFPATILISIIMASAYGSDTRQKVLLSGTWNFLVDSLSEGDAGKWGEKGLDRHQSRKVSVPHAWNTEKGLESYWGICWYERNIDISHGQDLKTARLQFDGVYHDAEIYVNGKKAGEHQGSGYTRFFIDITGLLHPGTNILTVKVDNSPSHRNIPFLKSYDWANDGGILRNVFLLLTESCAIRNIKVTAEPQGKTGRAGIRISFLDSLVMSNPNAKLIASVTEENQKTAARIFSGELKGTYRNGYFESQMSFDNINAWHFDSPDLYKITVGLYIDDRQKDEYSVVFGFRSIRIENGRYVLNGEPMRLMGVEWMPGSDPERGMAEGPEQMAEYLRLMKEANCIFTRFHFQQDEFVLDWCDRNGILVQEEIPYWGWETYITDTLLSLGIRHLNEMTEDHFNHPSIIAWGIGNEVDSKNPSNIAALKNLYDHAKNADPSRLVNYVSNHLFWGFPGEGKELPDATSYFDMMMFNEYFSTWHGKTIDAVSEELDKISGAYPDKPVTISEWGICEPVHKGGDPRRIVEMIKQNEIYGSKDYIAGAIYFCLNDYRTHMGEDSTYSYPQRVHGVCDINLNPKPSYNILKSISSPVLIKSAKINGDEVEIILCGKTGIPSYIIRNYAVVSDTCRIQIGELRPGQEIKLQFKSRSTEFAVVRPTGFEVIRSEIRQNIFPEVPPE